MSRATVTATSLMLAALAGASPGCGTDAQHAPQTQTARTGAPAGAQAGEQALARRLDGLYTASIRGLDARKPLRGLHIPAGLWALRIDVGSRTVELTAPEGGDVTLRLAGLDASHLRLAPDTACETRTGRTTASQFAWVRTDAQLRLRSVRAACLSDAAILTTAPWRAAWPTTPLKTDTQEASR